MEFVFAVVAGGERERVERGDSALTGYEVKGVWVIRRCTVEDCCHDFAAWVYVGCGGNTISAGV